jgi:uroporphyrinogen-III decarboxylase
MTGRERLLKTFKGESVDRVPICPWVYKNFIYEYFKIPPEEQNWRGNYYLGEKTIEVYKYFSFDLLHRLGTPWHIYDEKSSDDGRWIVYVQFKKIKGRDTEITTIKTPERILRQVKEFVQVSKYTYVEAISEYFIKDRSDFDQFLKYQPPFKPDDEFNNLTKTKEAVGDDGIVVSCLHGTFNSLNMYRKLEDIMMDPHTDEIFYREMIKYFGGRAAEIAKYMVEYGADVIEYAANLASGCVGPGFFEKFVLEYEKEFIDKIHSYGAFDIYHNCGDAADIMHLYNQLGTNAWGYLTPKPFGDVVLEDALKIIDKNIVLIGNIDQVEFMVKAKPQEIKIRVKEVLKRAKERGNFILSTTDWFFDNTPYENIKAFVEAGLEYGNYSK